MPRRTTKLRQSIMDTTSERPDYSTMDLRLELSRRDQTENIEKTQAPTSQCGPISGYVHGSSPRIQDQLNLVRISRAASPRYPDGHGQYGRKNLLERTRMWARMT